MTNMRSPHTGESMHEVESPPRPYNFRGETFEVGGPAWECPGTGERYFTPEQGDVFLARVHAAWRAGHGIGKEALRQRRQALGLSAAQASALLGFGVNQYRTYENTDKLPSKSNARLLRLLLDDRALPALAEAAGLALTAATRRKVQAHLAPPAATPRPATATSAATRLGTVGTGGSTEQFLPPPSPGAPVLAGDYSYAMAA